MDKIKKILFSVLMCLSLSVMLVGCSEKGNEHHEDDLTDIEEDIKEDMGDTFTYSRDKVDEAITYIHENIDKIDQNDVAQKVYEKAYYIEEVANHSDTKIDNDLTKYASQAKEYARNVYLANDDEVDDVVKKGKLAFDDFKTKFETDKDKFVDEFSGFFKK